MCTICVASDIAFSATTGILAPEGEHVSAVATPISSDIGYGFKPVRDAMINFLLIAVLKYA
jgi:hypothetical protein